MQLKNSKSGKVSPTILQKISMAGLSLLVVAIFIQSGPFLLNAIHFDKMLSAVLPSVIVDLTNKERTDIGLQPLERSALLDKAALLKANHMKQLEYFAHYSPQGVSPWYWFDVVKYNYVYAGENLAIYFDDSEDVVDAWMKSPLHKENIIKNEYTEIGVAAVKGKYEGYDTVYIVQLFGTPAYKKQTLAKNKDNVVAKQTEAKKNKREKVYGKSISAKEIKTIEDIKKKPIMVGDTLAYVSDHISTSTNYTASVDSSKKLQNINFPLGDTVKTFNYNTVINILYVLMAIIISTMLAISMFISERKKEHVRVVYGALLLFITVVTVLVHTQIVFAFALF